MATKAVCGVKALEVCNLCYLWAEWFPILAQEIIAGIHYPCMLLSSMQGSPDCDWVTRNPNLFNTTKVVKKYSTCPDNYSWPWMIQVHYDKYIGRTLASLACVHANRIKGEGKAT